MADRLTEEGAWAILAEPLDTPVSTLATRWGVSQQTVRIYKRLENDKAKAMHTFMLERGDTVHLMPPARPREERRGTLTDSQVREIRGSTLSSKDMAEQIGCSASMVRMIRTGKAYSHVGEE